MNINNIQTEGNTCPARSLYWKILVFTTRHASNSDVHNKTTIQLITTKHTHSYWIQHNEVKQTDGGFSIQMPTPANIFTSIVDSRAHTSPSPLFIPSSPTQKIWQCSVLRGQQYGARRLPGLEISMGAGRLRQWVGVLHADVQRISMSHSRNKTKCTLNMLRTSIWTVIPFSMIAAVVWSIKGVTGTNIGWNNLLFSIRAHRLACVRDNIPIFLASQSGPYGDHHTNNFHTCWCNRSLS